MAKIRVSTTVDAELLAAARKAHGSSTDSSLLEEALSAFLAAHRAREIDNAYEAAYGAHPLEEPDAWGDLASWHRAMDHAR
ncbi:MAG TPA: antitoxin MazE5 [Phycicoccus sp.]|jgi:Arc/MetJ family transcription regulator|nr:antitoxin MazE5 [Phycicoccus sp.]HQH06200.1 antitoxin MazE5 [Phycicoccus sp.]HQK30257.1 antitoxin MazE5 [Phycicoccus sp.]HQV91048.1 antitoxin MazE5 [Phycicoccus sp.]HQY95654.1 antitoxin MazE5 [Phycicoccus sp.]